MKGVHTANLMSPIVVVSCVASVVVTFGVCAKLCIPSEGAACYGSARLARSYRSVPVLYHSVQTGLYI